jgi:hypothetical protein
MTGPETAIQHKIVAKGNADTSAYHVARLPHQKLDFDDVAHAPLLKGVKIIAILREGAHQHYVSRHSLDLWVDAMHKLAVSHGDGIDSHGVREILLTLRRRCDAHSDPTMRTYIIETMAVA